MKISTLASIVVSLLTSPVFLRPIEAVIPPPDGGYPGGNTAEGQSALFSLSSGGYNTAVGFFSLRANTTNSFNTAVGAGALLSNAADGNTAAGAAALLSSTVGTQNTAVGEVALLANTTGSFNTANGAQALQSNTTGTANTATGSIALLNNTTACCNTADGYRALVWNTTGSANTVIGDTALDHNTVGSNNIAVGYSAGENLTTGDYNIDIGNSGVADEANTIRIGDDSHQGATFIAGVYGVSVAGLAVAMDSSGHLGTVGSSSRFKKEVRPMAQASEVILALRPVTFRYKKEIDSTGTAQFGLVAEDVEKVNPDLVVRDKQGKPYTVRYDQVNAMLLNEFLKEHSKVEQLEATVAEQQKNFETALTDLKEQIQKVSARVELNKPALRTIVNSQ